MGRANEQSQNSLQILSKKLQGRKTKVPREQITTSPLLLPSSSSAPKKPFRLIPAILAKHVPKNKNGPLTEFKLFPKLPFEIRRLIWKYCIAGDNSRIIKMWSTNSWPYYTAVPKFFQVSIEARREAFLAYGLPSLRQDFIRLTPQPLIRYDIDTVFVCDIEKSYKWIGDAASKNMRSQVTCMSYFRIISWYSGSRALEICLESQFASSLLKIC